MLPQTKGYGDEPGVAKQAKAGRIPRALQALATDTVDGHGQKLSEAEEGTASGQRGRSMRMKVTSSRLEALNAAAREVEERARAATAARMAAATKEAAAAKAKAASAQKAESALIALQSLLAEEEAPEVELARSAEMKQALAGALTEAELAFEKLRLAQTPRPSASALKETQQQAEGAAGQSAKLSSAMQTVANRWDLFVLLYGDEMGFVEGTAPTIEMAKQFVTFSFKTRLYMSREGNEGRGNSADGQHRYVQPRKLEGWGYKRGAAGEARGMQELNACVG